MYCGTRSFSDSASPWKSKPHAVHVEVDGMRIEVFVATERSGFEGDVELAGACLHVDHCHPLEELGVAGEWQAVGFAGRADPRIEIAQRCRQPLEVFARS